VETTLWQWGPFRIGLFSLLFFTAVLAGLVMVLAEGRRKQLSDQKIIDLMILAVVSGIGGSRLSYVILFNLAYYLEHPEHLIRLQDGGMSFWGGLLFSFIVIRIWSGRNRLIMERYLDAAAPALTVSLALGYTASALNGRAMLSGYPWGITVGEAAYHPDGAYMIICLMALFFLIRRRREGIAYEGELFIWFILGYCAMNLGVDFFRDGPSFAWILTVNQVASLAAAILAVLFILAGPKIYRSSAYLGHNKYQIKPRGIILSQFMYFLLATAPLVVLYYQIQQSFIVR
jgi:phosphatidylglycerol---prolipoprotein diacylglyceryl transferase